MKECPGATQPHLVTDPAGYSHLLGLTYSSCGVASWPSVASYPECVFATPLELP